MFTCLLDVLDKPKFRLKLCQCDLVPEHESVQSYAVIKCQDPSLCILLCRLKIGLFMQLHQVGLISLAKVIENPRRCGTPMVSYATLSETFAAHDFFGSREAVENRNKPYHLTLIGKIGDGHFHHR